MGSNKTKQKKKKQQMEYEVVFLQRNVRLTTTIIFIIINAAISSNTKCGH